MSSSKITTFKQHFSPEEVRAQIENWYKIFIGRSIYLWLGVGFIVAGAFLMVRQGATSSKPGVTMMIGAVVYMLYICILRRKITTTQVYNALKNMEEFNREVLVTVSDTGKVSVDCNGKLGEHPLSEFTSAYETDSEIMLFVRKSGWLTLKKSGFTEEQYKYFKHNLALNRIVIREPKDNKLVALYRKFINNR